MKSKATKSHDDRKNMGSAEFFRKQRAERNLARPPQHWVESTLDGKHFTYEELVAMTDAQVDRIITAHWERP